MTCCHNNQVSIFVELETSFLISVIMPAPEECKEIEHEIHNEDSSSFTKEVFQEAFGDLYTEHVKITVKQNGADHGVIDVIPSVSTFKETYFGATKSHSVQENLSKGEQETLTEGRTKIFG